MEYNDAMDIDKKCSIIEEFMRNFSFMPETYNHDDFINFRIYNDLGIPLAQAYEYDLVKLEPEGVNLVNETWINFCKMLEIDPEGDYNSISDFITEIDDED